MSGGRSASQPSALAALALAALGSWAGARNAPQAPAPDYRESYLAFAELLTRYRQGEDALIEPLRAAAHDFAARFGRSDAPRVVDYYVALGTNERAEGWRAYERFDALWRRVDEADAASWPSERADVLDELRALVASSIGEPDFVPAGRALSLCARIEVEELESSAGESRSEHEELCDRALADARSALALFERAGQLTPQLEPLWVLGRLDHLDGRLFDARERFEQCLRAAETVRSDAFREHALVGLVRLARAAGDPTRVDALLDELASFREPESCWVLAREHALRLLNDDLPEAAARFLDRCEPRSGATLAEWRRFAGLARLRAGELAGARELLLAGADESGEDGRLARATLALAEGRTQLVLADLGREESRAELSPTGRLFALSLAGEALLREGRASEAEALLAQAIERASEFERELDAPRVEGGTTASVFGERLGLHTVALCAEARVRTGRGLDAALLVESSQSRALAGDALERDDLAAWARQYEHGLVTYVCGADAGLALWVTRDGEVESLRVEHGRRALAEGARRLREAALAADADRVAALGRELARALLPEGLREELERERGGRLLVLAHGPIERLPIELLGLEGGELDELCATLVLPGLPARRPFDAAPLAGSERWILLGDPRDDEGGIELPAARAELDAVQAFHPDAQVVRARGLTSDAVRAALSSGSPLHFATHLVRDARCDGGRWSAVGLQLDGPAILCASEVELGASPPPLVVLSACETAEGRFLDAEGLLGLARAFLEAGARNLLVTLWPVRDDAARAFAPAFHAALREGALPSQAAREARSALREAGFGPADCAAFRLLGCD